MKRPVVWRRGLGAPGVFGSCRLHLGEMTEWSKVHDWKSCVPARVPRVRIPLSPPVAMT